MKWKTSRVSASRLLVNAIILISLIGICGCNYLSNWRNSQINKSSQAANSGAITPPATPVVIPKSIVPHLPVPENSVILEYQDLRSYHYTSLLSPSDALNTCKWLLGTLSQQGYESGDNPSRILEGVEYTKQKGKYPRIYVKVDLNSNDQCTIEFKLFKK